VLVRSMLCAALATGGLIPTISPADAGEIVVPATAECVDTNLRVRRGQRVFFSAIGTATYGFEGPPVDDSPVTNPDGQRFLPYVPSATGARRPIDGLFPIGRKRDPFALVPGPIGLLVGRVTRDGKPFPIGASGVVAMPGTGKLQLCYNDVPGAHGDNSGAYRVAFG